MKKPEKLLGLLLDDDTLIFFNFRADRAREITRVFIEKDFEGFSRDSKFPKVHFVCMTQYDALFDVHVAVQAAGTYEHFS